MDAARKQAPPPPLDLDEFVHAALDGAIGDIDQAAVTTQGGAIAAMRQYLNARYGRPLSHSEGVRLDVATAAEWNRRALPRQMPEKEILAEFDQDKARVLTEVSFPRAVADTEVYAFFRSAKRPAMRSWVQHAIAQLPEIPSEELEVFSKLGQLAFLELTRPLLGPETRLLNEVTRDLLTAIYAERQGAAREHGRRAS